MNERTSDRLSFHSVDRGEGFEVGCDLEPKGLGGDDFGRGAEAEDPRLEFEGRAEREDADDATVALFFERDAAFPAAFEDVARDRRGEVNDDLEGIGISRNDSEGVA